MFNVFRKPSGNASVGLINCMNNRGLGTESRLIKEVFDKEIPGFDLDVYKVPAGRGLRNFDSQWHTNKRFLNWLKSKKVIMTIETFMPKLYAFCREHGIKVIWRPNYEWIDPKYGESDFGVIDCIMTPQHACADFLTRQFQLTNVVCNPWICNLPITEKPLHDGKTRFLFNAGRGGIGDRRNTALVIEGFRRVLERRKDIHFTFKTQVECNVSSLASYAQSTFTYICRNTRYKKNLSYYAQADFSVAPSKWEGLGFAILESLYSGTPVLTVDAPPMNEWVRHKQNGFVVPSCFPDVSLPIPYDKENKDPKGLNWVRSAQCDVEEFVEAVLWMADNKRDLYENFHKSNTGVLNARKKAFIKTFEDVLKPWH